MNIPKISAYFETSLASSMSAAATSFSLVSATDRDGNALSGLYGFVIDPDTADREYVLATVSGTTATVVYRGIDADAPNTEITANKKAHRRGAIVKISDYPILGVLRNLLNGDDTLPNKISYASNPSFSSGSNELASVKFVEDTASAGAANASTTVKGLVEEATQAEIDADTGAGATGARLAVNPSTLATSKYGTQLPSSGQKSALASTATPGASNKYISQADFQIGAEIYAASATGNDSYAITLSPAPAAYVTGMHVRFKTDVGNTGAATLNVNSLGAKTIKKLRDQDLATGDIEASQMVDVVYDGTNFQMQSQIASSSTGITSISLATGIATRAGDAASGSQTIAHGLSSAPKRVKITAVKNDSVASQIIMSVGNYVPTTTACVFWANGNRTAGNDTTNMVVLKDNVDTTKQEATISVDGTNITLTWTKTGSPNNGTISLLWEAETNA